MKFHELAVGDKFKFNNEEYRKIPEIKVTCCKVKENSVMINSGQKAVFKPFDEIEKINES